jgi:hypothetical protein
MPSFRRRKPEVSRSRDVQLGVSSSAIGKAVARMEERLGVRLFHRSTRSITLTAEGSAASISEETRRQRSRNKAPRRRGLVTMLGH